MKKTIAILLVLVIGMVGVFADGATYADANASPKGDVKINLTTTVEPFTYFALSAPTLASVDFSSVGAFIGNENLKDTITYTDADHPLTDFANPVNLAKIWGINNTTAEITLTVSTGGFVGADETTTIPLTVSLTNKKINKAVGTVLGTLASDNIISAVAATPAQVHTALAQEYTATITIAVSTEG